MLRADSLRYDYGGVHALFQKVYICKLRALFLIYSYLECRKDSLLLFHFESFRLANDLESQQTLAITFLHL